jgi:hypothetical protein
MTPSTEHTSGAMSGIVETVGHAVTVAHRKCGGGIFTESAAAYISQAAIRATIEYLRGNMRKSYIDAAYEAYEGFEGAEEGAWGGLRSAFEAMLSQALKEITRSQALDELGELDGELLSDLDHSKTPEVTR